MNAPITQAEVRVPLGEDYPEIRDSVRRICTDFPGVYWRDLDAREAYPTGFVNALTEAGYLAALIPEQYGGAVPGGAALRRGCEPRQAAERGCRVARGRSVHADPRGIRP